MTSFDYNTEAELYPSRSRGSRRQPVGYKRFDRAAEAIQFAIEELSPESLVGAYLEVGEERFDAREMRSLYDAAEYPLKRSKPPAAADTPPAHPSGHQSSHAPDPSGRKAVRWGRS